MHPLELSLLLHQALETRAGRLLELTGPDDWWESIEALHDARVASRRLRAVLRLLDPGLYPGLKRQQKRLEDFTEILGTVRELDVHNQILEELGPELPGPHGWAALEHVLERVDTRRSKARKRLPARIKELELAKIAILLPAPEMPYPFHALEPHEAAWALLKPHTEAIGDLVPEQQREENPTALHQLRIHAKKLRYTLEILSPVFIREPQAPLKELRALQTVLGDHHDFAVLESDLQALQEGLEHRARRVLSEGLQEILHHLSQERATHYDRFREIADLYAPPGFSRELHRRLGLPGDPA
ncbi:CHAD domain-containing protein [Holophaga foetida]|uniref:CHAD domain-containing protein n=1 Tax=Holophaga foetida TaxID=35839 RepID=UPI0002DB55D9|nr:CHAD domain-containing protein [Holophaga foetida]